MNTISPKTDHFGRYAATAVLDMEEIDSIITRAIENWTIDISEETYSTKLILSAMRVLTGGDARRGHY